MKRILVAILCVVSVFVVGYTCDTNEVTDTGNGKKGQILVNNKDSQGTWTDSSFLKGEQGIQGVAGQDGITGLNGTNGVDGAKGNDGLNGTNGLNGKDGLNGVNGLNGVDGVIGVTGTNGDKGDQGVKGDNGKDVDPAVVTSLTGSINAETSNRIAGDKQLDSKVNTEVTNRVESDKSQQLMINDQIKRTNNLNNQVNNLDSRVGRLEETKMIMQGEVRLFDSQHTSVYIFDMYDVGHGSNFAYGVKASLKLGKSYEERLLAKQEREIVELKMLMGQLIRFRPEGTRK